ncbi:MAG: peptidoglycan DD-metalloendopeptidase family protein [Bacteroidales bacterium]|nr:peptidoglycan DD-metalloendopeptidase family protein [Bacteroidales bacterium]
MKAGIVRYGLIFIISMFSVLVFQQSSAEKNKASLEQKKSKLEEEISLTNRLLEDTRKKKGNIVQELNLLNTLIRQRDLLVAKLKNDMEDIDSEIRVKTFRINESRDKLEQRRKEYAKLIYIAYKNRDANMDLMYLLASESLTQLFARYEYLVQYRANRLSSITEIERLLVIIGEEIVGLEQQRSKVMELEDRIASERDKLIADQARIDRMVKNLNLEEKSLKDDLEKKRREMKEIENLIAKEVKKILEEESKSNNFDKVHAENKLISDKFNENKGRLPWPTEKGVVTCKFGEYDVANRNNLEAINLGIDIATVPGAKARAVFDGVVTRIAGIKGTGRTVIVKHGNYFTVYHNMGKLDVVLNQQVKMKQAIGEIFYDATKGQSILQFSIWNMNKNENPEVWLSN